MQKMPFNSIHAAVAPQSKARSNECSQEINAKSEKQLSEKSSNETKKAKKYRDFSRIDIATLNDASSWINQEFVPKDPPFPVKLYSILSDPQFEDIIFWLPHGRSWRILKQRAFEEKVITHFFKHGRYASFARQVNGWGFRRVTSGIDVNSYYHELFLRGMPHLCRKMRRLTPQDIRNRKGMEDVPAPDFYELSRKNPLPELQPDEEIGGGIEHQEGVHYTARATSISDDRESCVDESRDREAPPVTERSFSLGQIDVARRSAAAETRDVEEHISKVAIPAAVNTLAPQPGNPVVEAVNALVSLVQSSQNSVPVTIPAQDNESTGLPVHASLSRNLGLSDLVTKNPGQTNASAQISSVGKISAQLPNPAQQQLKAALDNLDPQAISCLISTLNDVLTQSSTSVESNTQKIAVKETTGASSITESQAVQTSIDAAIPQNATSQTAVPCLVDQGVVTASDVLLRSVGQTPAQQAPIPCTESSTGQIMDQSSAESTVNAQGLQQCLVISPSDLRLQSCVNLNNFEPSNQLVLPPSASISQQQFGPSVTTQPVNQALGQQQVARAIISQQQINQAINQQQIINAVSQQQSNHAVSQQQINQMVSQQQINEVVRQQQINQAVSQLQVGQAVGQEHLNQGLVQHGQIIQQHMLQIDYLQQQQRFQQ